MTDSPRQTMGIKWPLILCCYFSQNVFFDLMMALDDQGKVLEPALRADMCRKFITSRSTTAMEQAKT